MNIDAKAVCKMMVKLTKGHNLKKLLGACIYSKVGGCIQQNWMRLSKLANNKTMNTNGHIDLKAGVNCKEHLSENLISNQCWWNWPKVAIKN